MSVPFKRTARPECADPKLGYSSMFVPSGRLSYEDGGGGHMVGFDAEWYECDVDVEECVKHLDVQCGLSRCTRDSLPRIECVFVDGATNGEAGEFSSRWHDLEVSAERVVGGERVRLRFAVFGLPHHSTVRFYDLERVERTDIGP